MKLDRKQLAEKLNITLNNLKQLERRGNLGKRLKDKGYRLINKYTEEKIYYEIEETKVKNIIKDLKVKKTHNFINYFNERIDVQKPNSVGDLANKADVNKNTIIKWDNTLQDKKIIAKDGFFYFRLEDNELIQVSQEEYKNFWKNKAYISAFKDLQSKYLRGDITLMQLQLSSAEVGVIISAVKNKYYFRVKKFKLNENNQLYIDIKNLIGGTLTSIDRN